MNDLNLRIDALGSTRVSVKDFQEYTREIQAGNDLEAIFLQSSEDKTTYELATSVLNALSFQYRIEAITKEKTDNNEDLLNTLKDALINWKNKIPQYSKKEITPNNLKKIQELVKYERFTKALLKNKKITDDFFKLIIRDEFPVKLAVQYFKMCMVDLQDCLLTKQVAVFDSFERKILCIKKENIEGKTYKDLLFKINKKFVSILDEKQEIETNDGMRTWKQIKEIWNKGKKFPAEMAILEEEGMIFFKPQGFKNIVEGVPVPINTTAKRYWEDSTFPKFLTLSKEKLEELLDMKIPDDAPYVATIQSSYIDAEYVDDAHGASFVYLLQEDGTYRCLPFGKYSKNFPQTLLEKMGFIGNTVVGELTLDPTLFYKHRTHAISFEFLKKDQVEKLLENYGKRVWSFQFAGNNCSYEWQLAFKEVLEIDQDYFRIPLLQTKFFTPLNYIFGTISWIDKYISSRLAFWMVHVVHVLCFSFRTLSRDDDNHKESASVYKELRYQHNLYVPGQLGKRIQEGKIKGIINFGGDRQFSNTRMV